MLFLVAFFVALAVSQDSPPVIGSATVQIDLTGFSPDVSVSFSTDSANVYRSQGGALRTYTVPTVNSPRTVQVVITEGAAASFSTSQPLQNGQTWVVTSHRATLRIHLENYGGQLPPGNTFNVKLRVTQQGQDQVFREYNDVPNPLSSSTVPLSALGPIPTTTFYSVVVLAVSQPVTVWAAEWYNGVQAVWVTGHNGNGLTVDSNCADFACTSGRLVARATYQMACNAPFDYQLPTVSQITLFSNPSPTVSPVQIVRRSTSVAPSTFVRYVLAVDNYQFEVVIGNVKRVAALNCAIGECEAAPLASVLSVYSSTLRGSLSVSVDNVPFNVPYAITGDVTRICVLNLPLTSVTATFNSGGVVTQRGIDCGDVNQLCSTYVYANLSPNYSCLIASGVAVAVTVETSAGINVYQRWGVPEATLVVPALPNLRLRIYDGLSQWTPAGFFPAVVNSNANSVYPVTDCTAFQDTGSIHQVGNAPGQCGVTDRVDRMLSIFDLAFLPVYEPGFEGNGQLPILLPNTSVTVTLQLPGAQVFRFVPNQGGAPRMYCVLPVVVEAKITENAACFTSDATDCRVANPVPSIADCSVCDFLSVLQYDLKNLPRDVSSQIFVGPIVGVPNTIVTQNFETYATPNCFNLVSGSLINFYTSSPRSETIEVWRVGCGGAPATFSSGPSAGQQTGNTLKVGRVAPTKKSVANPPINDRSCVEFITPEWSETIDVSFYAWNQGQPLSLGQLGYVTAVGERSGASLKAWVQFTRGQWNYNTVRLLDTLPQEKVTVCFVQADLFGFNVDNIVISTQLYPLSLIRSMAWQGNFFKLIPRKKIIFLCFVMLKNPIPVKSPFFVPELDKDARMASTSAIASASLMALHTRRSALFAMTERASPRTSLVATCA